MLLAYILVKVMRAFRALSEARIRVYTEHLTYLHQMAHAVRHDLDWPEGEIAQNPAMNVIGSFPVMRSSSAALEAVMACHQVKTGGKSPAEIAAAEQALEAALVDVNVKMRDDLKLNTGAGQFPNAEVFRRKRGT